MNKFKPAAITKGSFAFCRATIAILLWASILFQQKWIVVLVFLIMACSALLRVEKAPLILLYKNTIDRIKPSETIIVDEIGIYVSHIVGSVFSLICIAMLYFCPGVLAWVITALFAVLQTSAACGFCSALKLYNCINGGRCCRFGKLVKKGQSNV